jgi:hypothetical protein
MNGIEIPKPVGIAIAVVVIGVILGGVWWRTGMVNAQGSADAQKAVSTSESQEFQQKPAPTVVTGTPQPARD